MKTRELGRTGRSVSAIGMGCMGLSHAYGPPTPHEEAVETIRQAFDLGYTFFDTAEGYTGTHLDGSFSHNEQLVGEALREHRDQVVIATKFGVRLSDAGIIKDSRPETIRRSVESSLSLLDTDHIDLYYQHRQDPAVRVEDVAQVMQELIDEGVVGSWGLSDVGDSEIRRAHKVCPVSAVQNRYSMMARAQEDLFPTFEELGITLVAFSPMANGFLTARYDRGERYDAATDYRARMPQFNDAGFDANHQLLALVDELASQKSCTPAQISLAWMLAKRPFIVPIPGSRRVDRLQENAAAAEVELTPAEIHNIDQRLGQLPAAVVFGGSTN